MTFDLPPSKTLAELLAVEDPRPEVPDPQPHTPPPTAKAWAKQLLHSPEYRTSLLRRVMLDELPPALECRLWEYAYGKPVERMEVKMPEALDGVQMDAIQRRVQMLQETIRMLALRQGQSPEVVEDEDGSSSIH